MKKIIKEYEEGKIISEKTKSDIDTIKSESLSQIEELKSKITELNANNLNKIKEYKNLITTAKTELDKRNKTLEEYELIALRQEDQIDKLNAHIYELNQAMFKKDLSMKQNENYSNQLINIINEHKLKIKKMEEKKKEEDNNEIKLLKRENKNLKNELEIEQKIIQNMKLNHQNLQGKYLTMCYNVKKKEQEELIKQAKYLTKENLYKKNKNNKLRIFPMIKSSSLGSLQVNNKFNKFKLAKNKNKLNINIRENKSHNNINDIDNITVINDINDKEGNKQNNINYNEYDYRRNLDEINDKLKQIIDDN